MGEASHALCWPVTSFCQIKQKFRFAQMSDSLGAKADSVLIDLSGFSFPLNAWGFLIILSALVTFKRFSYFIQHSWLFFSRQEHPNNLTHGYLEAKF